MGEILLTFVTLFYKNSSRTIFVVNIVLIVWSIYIWCPMLGGILVLL